MATITESQWVSHFGFDRFPFDRPESGNEEFFRPDFLASCFVEPKNFERVFGQADAPVTSLLFAERGTGKTACRVMMDYYCQNGLARLGGISKGYEQNYVLSVPHVHLDNVLGVARQSSPNTNSLEILVEHHVVEIMRQAVPAFVKMLGRSSEFAENVKKLTRGEFEDLSLFTIVYSAYLTSSQKDFLRNMGVEMPPLNNPMRGFVGQSSLHDRPSTWESVLYQQRLDSSPLNHLERWVELIYKIGIKAAYVLVDGVDELMESAQDPNYAYSLIRPLLTHLRLMDETHYLALKFFLPSNMEQLILSDPAFRHDRGFVIQKIEWGEEDLINILRKRLTFLNGPAGFDALCVPELTGEIEGKLARDANGNPRYLMNLCAQMVAVHCSYEIEDQDELYQLNQKDYLNAVERVSSMYRKIAPNQSFHIGEVLHGRYRVEKIINTKHSQVIKAWDESLKRFVAIKLPLIDKNRSDENLVDRLHKNLRREAELLARLHHQNIGQVFDILEEPFGVIMEWVSGRSIQDILDKEEQLSVYDTLLIGIGVTDALAYAHREKVIHRDIKPSNIIVFSDNIPKLIDFDIAKEDTAMLAGTPRYSSPEQLNEIGKASDIFSLGVVLYEMLTLEKPYEYGNRLAQYEDNFPKPSPHKIPKHLYEILLSMLDGKPSKRPKADDLKRELHNYLQTQNPTGEDR